MDGSVDGFAGPRATLKAITVATRTDKKKNDDFGDGPPPAAPPKA